MFAKDASHHKLALKYDSRNVVYTDVDAQDGGKVKATVVFPRDPKRRLEVLWQNDTARSDTRVISINGQSKWAAPKGLRLGLPIAAVEKINGRPFKLSAVGADGSLSVTSWEGGALSSLPGGCQIGMRLTIGAATPANVRGELSGDRTLASSDKTLHAAKPTVAEILIGY